jgi:hypothetical protein
VEQRSRSDFLLTQNLILFRVRNSDNRANSDEVQLSFATRAELGKIAFNFQTILSSIQKCLLASLLGSLSTTPRGEVAVLTNLSMNFILMWVGFPVSLSWQTNHLSGNNSHILRANDYAC